MDFVTAQSEAMLGTAANLQGIGEAMSGQSAAAATPTTGVVPAAADEVSVLAAAQFAMHAQLYQMVAAQAGAVHQALVATLVANAGAYAGTEAANTAAMG